MTRRTQITLAPWVLPAVITLALCSLLFTLGRLTRHEPVEARRLCTTHADALSTTFGCAGGGMRTEACIARYTGRTHLVCMTDDQRVTADAWYWPGARATFRVGDRGQIVVDIGSAPEPTTPPTESV